MKRPQNILAILITMKFLLLSNSCFSMFDITKMKAQVDSIIIGIVGQNNFDKNISFNEYRSNCFLYTGNKYVGSSGYYNKLVEFTPNQYVLWYDLDLVKGNFIDDRISVRVLIDSGYTKISISGLPNCFTDTTSCSKYLTIDDAKNIAVKAEFAKGLTNWQTRFGWEKKGILYLRNDSVKILLDQGYYSWTVSNVLLIKSPEPCLNGDGEMLEIDAITGAILDRREVSFMCDY